MNLTRTSSAPQWGTTWAIGNIEIVSLEVLYEQFPRCNWRRTAWNVSRTFFWSLVYRQKKRNFIFSIFFSRFFFEGDTLVYLQPTAGLARKISLFISGTQDVTCLITDDKSSNWAILGTKLESAACTEISRCFFFIVVMQKIRTNGFKSFNAIGLVEIAVTNVVYNKQRND